MNSDKGDSVVSFPRPPQLSQKESCCRDRLREELLGRHWSPSLATSQATCSHVPERESRECSWSVCHHHASKPSKSLLQQGTFSHAIRGGGFQLSHNLLYFLRSLLLHARSSQSSAVCRGKQLICSGLNVRLNAPLSVHSLTSGDHHKACLNWS